MIRPRSQCTTLAIGLLRLEGELGARQARELVAFLVVNRRRTVSRDELLAALWSDDAPTGAAKPPTRCCPASPYIRIVPQPGVGEEAGSRA
jgi:hypothetical protein